ncbi:MAG TPA: TIGR03936 family radical SAM-associated protein [Clostridia bacterium]|nr:TIGR03936 family radical SAM-associated protein [Clostridia bacterium]
MPKYRIKFARLREARFVAHLDIARAFERAVRRTGEPMVFTKGFNPHPKISFAFPAQVGITAQEEFVDIELSKSVVPEEFASKLNDVLPKGITVIKVRPVCGKAPSLMSLLKSATYRVSAGLLNPIQEHRLMKDVESFLGFTEINVDRVRKGKKSIINIREGILKLTGRIDKNKGMVFEMHLQAGSTGNIRPEEVLNSFLKKYNYRVDTDTIEITRTGLYSRTGNEYISLWKC